MQGTGVWSLGLEDPTCHAATEPVHHTAEAHVPSARTLQLESSPPSPLTVRESPQLQ